MVVEIFILLLVSGGRIYLRGYNFHQLLFQLAPEWLPCLIAFVLVLDSEFSIALRVLQ